MEFAVKVQGFSTSPLSTLYILEPVPRTRNSLAAASKFLVWPASRKSALPAPFIPSPLHHEPGPPVPRFGHSLTAL